MKESWPSNKSYVLRSSKITPSQKKAYMKANSKLIPFGKEPINWASLFPSVKKRIVEIGFGMGDATRIAAKENPDWGILGIEVHKPGIGKLFWWAEQESLNNIAVVEYDAVDVMNFMIAPESLDAVHIWFPDPWPKKRHQKRRLIQPDFIHLVGERLNQGGYIHLSTDWESYANQILEVLNNNSVFQNRYSRWADSPCNRPETKFERKGRAAGRIIRDIIFEKVR